MGRYVITGSASGIGHAVRTALEGEGHQVIGVDLRDAEVTTDLADPEQRSIAVAKALDMCDGGLDGLVPAAGIGPPSDPAMTVSVNWFGSEAFLRGLRPALAKHGESAAVAICSNSTTVTPGIPADLVEACLDMDEERARALATQHESDALAYAASKTAIARYVRRNAVTDEWAGAGIRLNAIAPGATLTAMTEKGLADEQVAPLLRGFPVPTGGFGTPEQIAYWILAMMRPEGRFMCGSIVFVDGGSDALIRPDAWPATY